MTFKGRGLRVQFHKPLDALRFEDVVVRTLVDGTRVGMFPCVVVTALTGWARFAILTPDELEVRSVVNGERVGHDVLLEWVYDGMLMEEKNCCI